VNLDLDYVVYAVVALLAYSFVAPLVSIGTDGEIPSDVALVVSNGILVTVGVAVVLANGVPVGGYLTHPDARYLYAAGVFLSIGILAYYRALGAGPVSVVVPIFGLFIVTSSVVGVVFLDEAFTTRKALGIVLAVVAIYLTTVE
jgi:transporter family protein